VHLLDQSLRQCCDVCTDEIVNWFPFQEGRGYVASGKGFNFLNSIIAPFVVVFFFSSTIVIFPYCRLLIEKKYIAFTIGRLEYIPTRLSCSHSVAERI